MNTAMARWSANCQLASGCGHERQCDTDIVADNTHPLSMLVNTLPLTCRVNNVAGYLNRKDSELYCPHPGIADMTVSNNAWALQLSLHRGVCSLWWDRDRAEKGTVFSLSFIFSVILSNLLMPEDDANEKMT